MLAQRLLEGRSREYDFRSEFALPRWLDRGFEGVLAGERRLVLAGVVLPFGGSRVVVAGRRADAPALA